MAPVGTDDLSLPKATVQKIINEILAHDPGVSFARDTRDLLIECCVEFITLVSSEANDIAEKEAKKTIACEHVTTALEQLGWPDYVPEILKVAHEHKTQQVVSCAILMMRFDYSPANIPATVTREEAKQDRTERPDGGGVDTAAAGALQVCD
jgi:histone H3/H4